MSTEDGDIIKAISNSEEKEIFLTDTVIDLIDYRWKQFAFYFHFVNVMMHFTYCIYLFFYIKTVFIDQQAINPQQIIPIHQTADTKEEMWDVFDPEVDKRIYPYVEPRMQVVQGLLLLFPIFIASTQLLRNGWKYWITPYYWIEILNIFFGLLSIYCQAKLGTWNITSKIVLILLISISLIKTIMYLKVFMAFSYIVTMII